MDNNSFKSVQKSEMDSWRQWAKQIKSKNTSSPTQNNVSIQPSQPSQLAQSNWEPIIPQGYIKNMGCNSCRRFR